MNLWRERDAVAVNVCRRHACETSRCEPTLMRVGASRSVTSLNSINNNSARPRDSKLTRYQGGSPKLRIDVPTGVAGVDVAGEPDREGAIPLCPWLPRVGAADQVVDRTDETRGVDRRSEIWAAGARDPNDRCAPRGRIGTVDTEHRPQRVDAPIGQIRVERTLDKYVAISHEPLDVVVGQHGTHARMVTTAPELNRDHFAPGRSPTDREDRPTDRAGDCPRTPGGCPQSIRWAGTVAAGGSGSAIHSEPCDQSVTSSRRRLGTLSGTALAETRSRGRMAVRRLE